MFGTHLRVTMTPCCGDSMRASSHARARFLIDYHMRLTVETATVT